MKNIDYSGKKVSIGIDVHKKHYTVTCISDGAVAQKVTMPSSPEALLGFIQTRFKGAEINTAYEAGFSGFKLHRVLESSGIKSIVINAASLEVAARDRVKTDKRDSLKIAQHLELGRLKAIRVPTEEEESARLIHRTREQILKKRTQVKNQIRMRFYYFGITLPQTISVKRVEQIVEDLKLSSEFKLSMSMLLRIWSSLNQEILLLRRYLSAAHKNTKLGLIYGSIPGFGHLTSRMILTELGDMSQFPNERTLFSFLGLTPSERSSGEKEYKGHISRQGSARMRCILVEAAWGAVRYDKYWSSVYKRMALRIGGKRAIVAIARRLIGVARALVNKGEIYKQQEVKLAA